MILKRVVVLSRVFMLALLFAGVYLPGPDGASVVYRTGATPVGVTVTPALDGRSVTLEPTTRLKAGRWYYVSLWKGTDGITDLTGDSLSEGGNYLVDERGNFVYWWFKTRA